MAVLGEVAQGMARTGFRKLVLLNGHGGNSDHVGVVSQDLVARLGVCAVWPRAITGTWRVLHRWRPIGAGAECGGPVSDRARAGGDGG